MVRKYTNATVNMALYPQRDLKVAYGNGCVKG